MLNSLIGNSHPERFWFCGHTSLKTRYRFTESRSLIEIHNPELRTLVIIDPLQPFDPEQHIIDLPVGGD